MHLVTNIHEFEFIMHINLLQLIDERIGEGLQAFITLPFNLNTMHFTLKDELTEKSGLMMKTYAQLLVRTGLVSEGCLHYNRETWNSNLRSNDKTKNVPWVYKIIQDIEPTAHDIGSFSLFPLHHHQFDNLSVHISAGCTLINYEEKTYDIILNNFSVDRQCVHFNTHHLHYLTDAITAFGLNDLTVRDLAVKYLKTYQRFLRDSEAYFGCTFYQFYNKYRLFRVINDIMLSKLSLKEIAYKNNFSSYSSMHALLSRYDMSVADIPRLYTGI